MKIVILRFVIAGTAAIPALLWKRIVDAAFSSHSFNVLFWCIGGMLAAGGLGACVALVEGRLSVELGENIIRGMRSALMSHLLDLPISFFRKRPLAEIVNRVVADIDNVEEVVINTVSAVVANVVSIIISLALMLFIAPELAGIATLLMLFAFIPLSIGERRMYAARKRTRAMRDDVEKVTQESLSYSAISVMKSFNREAFEVCRHEIATDRLRSAEVGLQITGRTTMVVVALVRLCVPASVWLFGAFLVFRHHFSVGSLVAFTMYLLTFSTSIEVLGTLQIQLGAISALFERIFEFLEQQPERSLNSTTELTGPVSIRASNMTSRYSDDVALHVDRLEISPGEFIAVVGSSGSGKSTLVGAFLRLVDSSSSSVYLNGILLEDVEDASLRRHLAVVPQDVTLSNETLRDNLLYGLPPRDDQVILTALSRANLAHMLDSLPDGLDTLLGEHGTLVSGGERQRIAIARAMLREPSIVFYDEVLNGLDPEAERLCFDAIRKRPANQTAILITHRCTLLSRKDRVIVMSGGRIVEDGLMAELLELDGLFAAQYALELQYQRLAMAI